MNVGSYIFSQVVDFIPRYQFDKLVVKYHGDWHAKDLTSYNQLLHLLFGQITGCDSLRDICLCLEAHMYSKAAVSEITVDNVLYALDSTTISTSIKLATWALGKYSRGAVK